MNTTSLLCLKQLMPAQCASVQLYENPSAWVAFLQRLNQHSLTVLFWRGRLLLKHQPSFRNLSLIADESLLK